MDEDDFDKLLEELEAFKEEMGDLDEFDEDDYSWLDEYEDE